jgi:hypothetical protein
VTSVLSGPAEADAWAYGGQGGDGSILYGGNGGAGGDAIASSTATSGGSANVSSFARATAGEGGLDGWNYWLYGPSGFAAASSTATNALGSVTTTAFSPTEGGVMLVQFRGFDRDNYGKHRRQLPAESQF